MIKFLVDMSVRYVGSASSEDSMPALAPGDLAAIGGAMFLVAFGGEAFLPTYESGFVLATVVAGRGIVT